MQGFLLELHPDLEEDFIPKIKINKMYAGTLIFLAVFSVSSTFIFKKMSKSFQYSEYKVRNSEMS